MNKLPLIIFAVLVALFLMPMMKHKDPAVIPSVLTGKPAPAFSLPAMLDGKPGFTPQDLKHGTVIVNFFASWCLTCHEELAVFADIGVPVYGIAYKDTSEKLIPWLKQYGDPYFAVVSDKDGRAAIDWGATGIPETFIIDKGIIRSKITGPVTPESLRAELQK